MVMPSKKLTMKKFVHFLFSKTYRYHSKKINITDDVLQSALQKTYLDVKYHFPDISIEEVINKIECNSNELSIFLYRLGNFLYSGSADANLLDAVSWLMKDLCACEIYYSNQIDTGFYVVHGVGTVIGSRNTIGKGFIIYQNCTIGKKKKGQLGCSIGSDVRMYANSQIIGDVKIGDNVIIGNYSRVTNNIPSNTLCKGNPAKIIKTLLPSGGFYKPE